MEMESNREEGEISDDDDVIITQVTHVRNGPSDGNRNANGTKDKSHNFGKIITKLTEDPSLTSNNNININPHSVLAFHGEKPFSSHSNPSSGFIDRMRQNGTNFLSNIATRPYNVITGLKHDVTAMLQPLDVASIPPPPPPPLPKTPPPSVPMPPPEDAFPSTVDDKDASDVVDDDFVDSLLEEVNLQVQKDLDDMQDKTEVVDMELESSDDGEIIEEPDSKIIMTKPPDLDDEDEDLDVLELRLAALASYAKSTRQALEVKEKEATNPSSVERSHHTSRYHSDSNDEGHFPAYRRDGADRKRKRSGDDSVLSRRRYIEERREREKRLRAEEKLRREEDRRLRMEEAYRRERSLREDERKERKRLQEVEQKLNDLQNSLNPTNMMKMMLQIAAEKSKGDGNDMLSFFSKMIDSNKGGECQLASASSERETEGKDAAEYSYIKHHDANDIAPEVDLKAQDKLSQDIVDTNRHYAEGISQSTDVETVASQSESNIALQLKEAPSNTIATDAFLSKCKIDRRISSDDKSSINSDNIDCISMDMDSGDSAGETRHDESEFAGLEDIIFSSAGKASGTNARSPLVDDYVHPELSSTKAQVNHGYGVEKEEESANQENFNGLEKETNSSGKASHTNLEQDLGKSSDEKSTADMNKTMLIQDNAVQGSARHGKSSSALEKRTVIAKGDMSADYISDKAVDAVTPTIQTSSESSGVYEFNFPTKMCGMLIGSKGKQIRKIMKGSGATITLKPKLHGQEHQICTVKGQPDQIKTAVRMIKAKFPRKHTGVDFTRKESENPMSAQIMIQGRTQEENETSQSSDSADVYAFDFPSKLCKSLIGSKGKSIKAIKKKSGTTIVLSPKLYDKEHKTCTITGRPDQIEMALSLIKKKFPKTETCVNYSRNISEHPMLFQQIENQPSKCSNELQSHETEAGQTININEGDKDNVEVMEVTQDENTCSLKQDITKIDNDSRVDCYQNTTNTTETSLSVDKNQALQASSLQRCEGMERFKEDHEDITPVNQIDDMADDTRNTQKGIVQTEAETLLPLFTDSLVDNIDKNVPEVSPINPQKQRATQEENMVEQNDILPPTLFEKAAKAGIDVDEVDNCDQQKLNAIKQELVAVHSEMAALKKQLEGSSAQCPIVVHPSPLRPKPVPYSTGLAISDSQSPTICSEIAIQSDAEDTTNGTQLVSVGSNKGTNYLGAIGSDDISRTSASQRDVFEPNSSHEIEMPHADEDDLDASVLRAQLLASINAKAKNVASVQIEKEVESERQKEISYDDHHLSEPLSKSADLQQVLDQRPTSTEASEIKETEKADSPSEDEDESLMRAQLLAAVARKRREKLEAEIAKKDAEIAAAAKLAEEVKTSGKVPDKYSCIALPRDRDKIKQASNCSKKGSRRSPYKESGERRSPRSQNRNRDVTVRSKGKERNSNELAKDKARPANEQSKNKERDGGKARDKENRYRDNKRTRDESIRSKTRDDDISIKRSRRDSRDKHPTYLSRDKTHGESPSQKEHVSGFRTEDEETSIRSSLNDERLRSRTENLNHDSFGVKKDNEEILSKKQSSFSTRRSIPKESEVITPEDNETYNSSKKESINKEQLAEPSLKVTEKDKLCGSPSIGQVGQGDWPSITEEYIAPNADTPHFIDIDVAKQMFIEMTEKNIVLSPEIPPPVLDVPPGTEDRTESATNSADEMENEPFLSSRKIMSENAPSDYSDQYFAQQPDGNRDLAPQSMKISRSLQDVTAFGQRKVELLQSFEPSSAPSPLSESKVEIYKSTIKAKRVKEIKSKSAGNSREPSPFDQRIVELVPQEILRPEKRPGKKGKGKKKIPRKYVLKHGTREIHVPYVEPVIIDLNDNSTDDEPEAPLTSNVMTSSSSLVTPSKPSVVDKDFLGSLEMFLKEARASVEEQQQQKRQPPTPEALKTLGPRGLEEYKKLREELRVREERLKAKQAQKKMLEAVNEAKAEDAKKVHQLELRVQLQKKMMEQDQQNLETLNALVAKKKNVVCLAEKKIAHLEKQLLATKNILCANIQQVTALEEKSGACENQIIERQNKIKNLQKQMIAKGQDTFGSSYTPFLSSNPRLFEPEASPKAAANDSQNYEDSGTHLTNQHTIMKPGDLKPDDHRTTEEKERQELEKMHADLAALIQRHKDSVKQVSESQTVQVLPPKMTHVETEETMRVASGQEDEGVAVISVNPKKRRRSLKDLTLPDSEVTRPNLATIAAANEPTIKRVKQVQAISQDQDGRLSRESSPTGALMTSFKMPSGQHLSNLHKLYKENVEKDVWFSRRTVEYVNATNYVCAKESISVIPGAKYSPLCSKSSSSINPSGPLKPYTSSLLRFKSYRLNPFYRTKAGLSITSRTYSNKIDAKRLFCRFDLMGTCNDDKCPWQHHKAIQMTTDEVLEDLVSYVPEMTAISTDTAIESYHEEIRNYVSTFRDKNPVADNHQCVLMVNQVNIASKHVAPHLLFTETRKWRPHVIVPDEVEKESVHSFLIDSPEIVNEPDVKAFEDDILSEGDVRYYLLGSDVQDMETGVLEDPENVTLWLKLAYKKLHDYKSKKEENVDQALNVLSRALEANRNSSELWLHYLGIYSKRKDKSDLLGLCEQAIQYAPSYDLHWKLLSALPTISKKKLQCLKIEDYIKSLNKGSSFNEQCSNQMLEIILYRVQLCVIFGKTKQALIIMQGFVNRKKATGNQANDPQESDRCFLHQLTLEDAVLLCMCYLHLVEFRSLPSSLFEAASLLPGRLVNKEPFVFENTLSKVNPAIMKMVIDECCNNPHFEYSKHEVLIPLYRTLWQQIRNSDQIGENVEEFCRWLGIESIPFCIRKMHVELSKGEAEMKIKMYQELLTTAPDEDLQLYFNVVQAMMDAGKTENALEFLELIPAKFFDIDSCDERFDPNNFYCKLLKQPLPHLRQLPPVRKDVVENLDAMYLWAFYGLLLELEGYQSEVEECYESAIASLVEVKDLRFIWKCYLHYCYRRIQEACKNSRSHTASHLQFLHQKFHQFTGLVKRCLITMPSRLPMPYRPDSYWLDYSFHTDIVELYVKCCKLEDRVKVYEDFVRMMPENIQLVLRACKFFNAYGAKTLALGTSSVALEDFKHCLPLWKLYLQIASEIRSHKEVLRSYRKATQAIPHSIWLWTNYLIYAAVHGKEEDVKSILQKCKDLEINLADFASTVLK